MFSKHLINQAFKSKNVRPSYMKGLRFAFLVAVPLAVAHLAADVSVAFNFVLAALFAILADMGGVSRRKTMQNFLLAILINTLAAVVATYAAGTLWVAVVFTFFWLSSAAMLGILGNSGVMMSMSGSIVFVLLVSNPLKTGSAVLLASEFVGGGLWAMIVALYIWPIDAYKPQQKALAAAFTAHAAFLKSFSTILLAGETSDVVKHKLLAKEQAFTQSIQIFHQMSASGRKGRYSRSENESLYLLLAQSVERDHRACIVINDMILLQQQKGESKLNNELKSGFFSLLSEFHRKMAVSINQKKISEDELESLLDKMKKHELIKIAQQEGLSQLLDALRLLLTRMEEQIAIVRTGTVDKSKISTYTGQLIDEWQKERFWPRLKSNLTLKSSIFRHALRIGISSAIAVFICHKLDFEHGYWLPLTVVIIIGPAFGGDFFIRSLQRASGTVLGGLFAYLILLVVQDPLIIVFILVVLTVFAMAFQTMNYSISVFFMTPMVVCLYGLKGSSGWQIPVERVMETLMGAALALAAGFLIFPHWEKDHFPDKLRSFLAGLQLYFNAIEKHAQPSGKSPLEIIKAYRKTELEASNARASFQRMLNQPGIKLFQIEQFQTILALCESIFRRVLVYHYTSIRFKQEELEAFPVSLFSSSIDNNFQCLKQLTEKANIDCMQKQFTELLKKESPGNDQDFSETQQMLPFMELRRIIEIQEMLGAQLSEACKS